MKRTLALALIFGFIASACGDNSGTETGNAMDVTVAAISSAYPTEMFPIGADPSGTEFSVEEAYAYVNNIEFDLPEGTTCADFDPAELSAPVFCEEEDGDDGFRVEGPYVIDLIAGDSTPALRQLSIPPATYNRVFVRLDVSESGGPPVPADLLGNTLLARGSFSYDGSPAHFELALSFTEEARFEQITGVMTRDVLLALDVVDWFAAAPITECLDDGDLTLDNGTLTIQSSAGGACTSLEQDIRDGVSGSGELDEHEEEE